MRTICRMWCSVRQLRERLRLEWNEQ